MSHELESNVKSLAASFPLYGQNQNSSLELPLHRETGQKEASQSARTGKLNANKRKQRTNQSLCIQ